MPPRAEGGDLVDGPRDPASFLRLTATPSPAMFEKGDAENKSRGGRRPKKFLRRSWSTPIFAGRNPRPASPGAHGPTVHQPRLRLHDLGSGQDEICKNAAVKKNPPQSLAPEVCAICFFLPPSAVQNKARRAQKIIVANWRPPRAWSFLVRAFYEGFTKKGMAGHGYRTAPPFLDVTLKTTANYARVGRSGWGESRDSGHVSGCAR